MDWILGITTLVVNTGLGIAKGAWWMWGIHAINAAVFWNWYVLSTEQYGLILLNCTTAIVDIYFGARAYTKTNHWARRVLKRREQAGSCNCASCLVQSNLPADLPFRVK